MAAGVKQFFKSATVLKYSDATAIQTSVARGAAYQALALAVFGVSPCQAVAYDDIANYYNATDDSPGSAPVDPSTVGQDIANAHKVANVVIVMPHWGVEYTADPSDRQREFARAVAAAGGEMIVGNHPHWVQAHEQIGGTFVAYALGNFVFDQDWSLETQQGAMFEATFTGTKLTATRYIPIQIYDQYQPRLAEPPELAQILDRIGTASTTLADD